MTREDLQSKKVTNKLLQQLQDPLVLSAGALPPWCEHLTQEFPFLFPFDTRHLYFTCTAFGASRLVFLLNKCYFQELILGLCFNIIIDKLNL